MHLNLRDAHGGGNRIVFRSHRLCGGLRCERSLVLKSVLDEKTHKPNMTRGCQIKVLLGLLLWFAGLLVAYANPEFFSSIDWSVLQMIPAIESYALAAKYSTTAKALWTYAWIVAPLCFVWFSYHGFHEPRVKQKAIVTIVILAMTAAFFSACFFGLYEPYPGVRNGRWATFYRESELGVLTGTTGFWFGFYMTYLMTFIYFTGLFKVNHRN